MSATVFWQDVNELATISVTFTGTPTEVILTVTDPTGAVTTPTMTGSGAGPYTANVACGAAPGVWSYLVEGTGTASDAQAGTWTVTDPALTKLYCTPAELKSRLGITDTEDDFEITTACQAASRYVDEITGRYFWQGTDTRTYVPEGITRLPLDDLVSVTSLKVDRDGDGTFEETWTLGTDYQLEVAPGRYNTVSKGEAWPYTAAIVITGGKLFPWVWMWSHLNRVQVSGVFGWPAVPANVKQAAMITAAAIFKRKDAPFGIAGFNELGAVRVTADPMVLQLLRRYVSGDKVGV